MQAQTKTTPSRKSIVNAFWLRVEFVEELTAASLSSIIILPL